MFRQQAVNALWLILVFAAWLFISLYFVDARPSNDTAFQLGQVLEGVYIDWKPPLYSWLLLQCYHLGGSAANVYELAYFLQLFFLGAGVCLITHYLAKYRRIFLLLPFCLLFLLPQLSRINIVGNDAFFIAMIFMGIGSFLLGYQSRSKTKYLLALLCTWLCLFIAFVCRLNSLPAILFLIFSLSLMSHCKIGKSIIISICVLLSFVVMQKSAHHALGVEKSYPSNYFYASDMLSIALFKNEWLAIHQQKIKEEKLSFSPTPQNIGYAPDSINFYTTPINPYIKRTDTAYSQQLKEGWIDAIKKHPKEFLIARLYAGQQLVLAGRSLPFINDWIKQEYPHMTILQDKEHRNWRNYLAPSFFFFSLSNLLLASLCIIFIPLYFLKKEKWEMTPPLQISLIIALTGLFYLATFIPLTASSTEIRYFLPHSSCSLLALSILGLYFLDRCISYRKNQCD